MIYSCLSISSSIYSQLTWFLLDNNKNKRFRYSNPRVYKQEKTWNEWKSCKLLKTFSTFILITRLSHLNVLINGYVSTENVNASQPKSSQNLASPSVRKQINPMSNQAYSRFINVDRQYPTEKLILSNVFLLFFKLRYSPLMYNNQ